MLGGWQKTYALKSSLIESGLFVYKPGSPSSGSVWVYRSPTVGVIAPSAWAPVMMADFSSDWGRRGVPRWVRRGEMKAENHMVFTDLLVLVNLAVFQPNISPDCLWAADSALMVNSDTPAPAGAAVLRHLWAPRTFWQHLQINFTILRPRRRQRSSFWTNELSRKTDLICSEARLTSSTASSQRHVSTKSKQTKGQRLFYSQCRVGSLPGTFKYLWNRGIIPLMILNLKSERDAGDGVRGPAVGTLFSCCSR